ncbi:MAG TPA: GNAT family N-acetyltransferase [Blastocatellia bacterium]|jgi:GNAT superfamily N-acetyltransferase|nr:GNAT family N-acetyltransferase [Blastocatellia bacterium]
MRIDIRRASGGQSERLTQIAHAAKRHWRYPERWIESWKDVLTITPDYILNNEVYSATDGDDVLGFYALIADGDKATLDHLWIDPKNIGAGIGRELFNHAVRRATAMHASVIEIESDPNAEGFYKHMGARRLGETSSELDGQPRILPLLALEIKRET